MILIRIYYTIISMRWWIAVARDGDTGGGPGAEEPARNEEGTG